MEQVDIFVSAHDSSAVSLESAPVPAVQDRSALGDFRSLWSLTYAALILLTMPYNFSIVLFFNSQMSSDYTDMIRERH